MLVETFLQDCSADIGAEASTHLAEQSRSVTQQSVQSAAWQEVPSTYLVCTQARDTPVQAQREFARRARAVVDLLMGPAVTGFVTTEELLTAAYGAYKRAGHRWTAGCGERRRQVA